MTSLSIAGAEKQNFWAECKPLSKILFTLHWNGINICSLETCTGEEWCATLHLSSPTLHPENLRHLRNLRDFLQRPSRSIFHLIFVRNPKIKGWRVVKSGEEWCATLHLSQPQCLSGFQPIWWRVKSKKESGCFTSSRRIVLCLAMAVYCPGKGQCCAIVRQ